MPSNLIQKKITFKVIKIQFSLKKVSILLRVNWASITMFKQKSYKKLLLCLRIVYE